MGMAKIGENRSQTGNKEFIEEKVVKKGDNRY
jgi:hypothetical protein